MTPLQQIAAALGWNLRINENFVTVSPAGMYGRDPATTTGLTWGYLGGNFSGVAVASGTVALTTAATNYVVANRTTGVVTVATTTTNWLATGTYLQLYLVVAGASTVTSYDDFRQAIGGASGGGGSFTGGTLTSALNEAAPVTIASAATVAIGAAAANSITVAGTTAITAFDTIAAGALRHVTFSGILVLTYNATSMQLPGSASITTAVGDVAEMVSLGAGNWKCNDYVRATGAALVTAGGGFTGGTLSSALNEAPTVTIASSAAPAIGAAAGNSISLTGTTTVTGFDTIAAGAFRRVVFAGALVLTHNATSLILPTAASLTTAAGDVAEFLSLGAGNWRCTSYSKVNGTALAGSAAGLTWNAQTASYTLAISDANNGVEMLVAAANNLTIPLNATVAFPVGTSVLVYQAGAGLTTIVATAGVTIVKRGSSLAMGGQYALATLVKRATDTWILSGDIAP